MNKDENFKQKLIQYNLEDCLALKKLTDYAYKIEKNSHKQDNRSSLNINWAEDLKNDNNNSFKWGTVKFSIPEFNLINKCAYFDYQRDKIFIRTNKNFKRYKKRIERKYLYTKINKHIKIRAYSVCPYCKCKKLFGKREYKRVVIDLNVFNSGVKKWIVQ